MQIDPRYAVIAAVSCAALVAAVVAFGGTGTSFEDLPTDPTYGAEPAFAHCKEDVRDYLQRTLKDYDSAQIEWESTELEKGAFQFDDGEYHSVRYMAVLVNAKNGFGAYAGQRRWVFGWEGEELAGVSTDGGLEWATMLGSGATQSR
jgi:hypothetical protein